VSFAIAFAVGSSQGGQQAEPNGVACDYEMCQELCHGPAFCTDWGCVCI
jgi:hypothetical protein